MLSSIFFVFAILAILTIGVAGPAAIWNMMFGPPDLGQVQIETFRRNLHCIDALYAPNDYCQNARIDGTTPEFDLSVDALQARMRELLEGERELLLIENNAFSRTDRYIARSPLLQIPDTISIQFIPLGVGRSGLAIYSRSQFSLGRFTARTQRIHFERITRWLEMLGVINQPNIIAFPQRRLDS